MPATTPSSPKPPSIAYPTPTPSQTPILTLGTPGISGALAIWLCNGLIIQLILGRLALRFFRVRNRHRNRQHNRPSNTNPHNHTYTCTHNNNSNPSRNNNNNNHNNRNHNTPPDSKYTINAFTAGDYWILAALIFHEIRVIGDYYMNKSGTPLNVSVDSLITQVIEIPMTTNEQDGLVLAGKFMVVSRIAIVVVLWSLKMSILDTLNSFLPKTISGKDSCIRFMFVILGATFFAAFLNVFLECKPFQLNWAIFPDVAKCSFDVKWIVTYEICNIITDTMLLFLPFLLVLGSPGLVWNKAQMPVVRLIGMLVFVLGAALIVIETVRLMEGLFLTNMLLNRIVWGSIEVALATVVAVWPSILLQLEFEGRPEPSGQGQELEMGPIFARPMPIEEIRYEERAEPQQPAELGHGAQPPDEIPRENTPISKEMGPEHTRRRPASWNPMQNEVAGSILDVVLSEGKSRDSWPRRASAIRDSLRVSCSTSRNCMRVHNSEGDLQDARGGWIELDEMDVGSEFQERCTPTLEIEEYNNSAEVLIAREVEARRERQPSQRARLVTIPRRAKLKCSAEAA